MIRKILMLCYMRCQLIVATQSRLLIADACKEEPRSSVRVTCCFKPKTLNEILSRIVTGSANQAKAMGLQHTVE